MNNTMSLKQLERDIENDVRGNNSEKYGCFGCLDPDPNHPLCKKCSEVEACRASWEANQDGLFSEIEEALSKAGVEAEVKAEAMALDAHNERKTKVVAVEPEAASPENATAKPEAKLTPEGVNVDALKVKGRKWSVDWEETISKMVAEKPTEYKQVWSLFREQGVFKATAYDYTNKTLNGLQAQGVVASWDKKTGIQWV